MPRRKHGDFAKIALPRGNVVVKRQREIPLPQGEGGERSEPGEGCLIVIQYRLKRPYPHPGPLPKGEGGFGAAEQRRVVERQRAIE